MMNIGEQIYKVYEESGIDRNEFAQKMCCTNNMTWQFFTKKNIDIQTLTKLSRVLGHNFFLDLAEQPEVKHVQYEADYAFYFPAADEEQWEEEGIHDAKMDDVKMIHEYLRTKGKVYNKVTIQNDDDITYNIFVHFSRKQFWNLQNKRQEQTYKDVLDWNDLIANGDWYKPETRGIIPKGKINDILSINFTSYFMPAFTCYELESPSASPKITTFNIPMKKCLYAKLLSMLLDNHNLTVRQLEQEAIELYTIITNGVQLPIRCSDPVNPHIIFMTEAQEAVEEMVGEPDASDCLLMTIMPDDTLYSIWVSLNRRMIEVSEQTLSPTGETTIKDKFTVPAIDVYKKIGTSNFKETLEALKKNIDDKDAFKQLMALLL